MNPLAPNPQVRTILEVTMHGNAEPTAERVGSMDAARETPHTTTPVRRADHRFGQYEIKFLLGSATADLVTEWARVHMARDPVAACDERELYPVHSVYLDTPTLGVFGRAGALRTRKYRLRRYGNEDTIWLERKAKVRGRIKKRRTAISESELACLYEQAPPPHWAGNWFRRRVQLRSLQPVCSVTYERFARVGLTPEGPIRMTLDRAIGMDWNRSKIPPCRSRNNRYEVYAMPEAMVMSRIPGSM